MNKLSLSDGTGRWIDIDKALVFMEGRMGDTRDSISLATGNCWDHETLYITNDVRCILCAESDREESIPDAKEISQEVAAKWLVENGYIDSHMPACISGRIAALEVK